MIFFTLENNINRLFKTNPKADAPNEPDTQIIFYDRPYIFYPQITLEDNFLAYFNGTLTSHGALTLFRMGFFRAVHGWGGGKKTPPLPKISHAYPTKMKLGAVIHYLENIQKIYESRDTPLEFC